VVVYIYSLEEIGKRLKMVREPLRQVDLAKEFGVERTYIGHMEQGRAKPSLEYLMFISSKFKVSVDWILTGKGDIIANNNGESDALGEQILIIRDEKLRKYIRSLFNLWTEGNSDIKGWIIIQLEKAFPEIAGEIKKDNEKEETSG
jgi:transcriptional regulator with XRE-family HTH domain